MAGGGGGRRGEVIEDCNGGGWGGERSGFGRGGREVRYGRRRTREVVSHLVGDAEG